MLLRSSPSQSAAPPGSTWDTAASTRLEASPSRAPTLDHQGPSRGPLHLEHVYANSHSHPPGPIHKGSLEVSFLRPQLEYQGKIHEESASLYSEKTCTLKWPLLRWPPPNCLNTRKNKILITSY